MVCSLFIIIIMKSKTHQLLIYIVKNYTTDVSATGLMKLSYIVDLVSIGKGQPQISTFDYIRYNYGPFSKNIYEYVNDLVKTGVLQEESQMGAMGDEFIVYRFNKRFKPSFENLAIVEKQVIDEVLTSLKGYGAKALTELAYRTKPMQKIGAAIGNKKGLNEPLDLHAT